MTLTQHLHRHAQCRPSEYATIDADRRRTWSEVHERISRFAAALASLGIKRGDRVALLAQNSDHYFDYFYATWWLGAVVNPVNIRWSTGEIAYSLDDSLTELLFVDRNFEHLIPEILEKSTSLRMVRSIDAAEHEEWIASYEPVPDQRPTSDDMAAILYTGGTTGFPKGVMLSHRNMLASALGVMAMPGCQTTGCYMHVPPLFHIGALAGLVLAMVSGSTNVFLKAFDPVSVMETVMRERVTEIFLVPTMIRMLLDHPQFGDFDLSCLRKIRYGASTIDDALLERALGIFPGVSFVQAYGMTELSPVATILAPEDHIGEARARGKTSTAGRATSAVEVRIIGPDAEELPRGEVGEIVVRGDTVMMGYWGKPEATAEAIRNGWMHTGDLGTMDTEGYVVIVDRLKDLIITGGENVYSAEVENALSSHPSVSSVAVIALPDDRWGERVHAVVIPKGPVAPEAEDLQAHVRAQIAGYKVPKTFSFVDTLPLSAAGKVLKNILRERFLETAKQ
ncbi:MAG: fatty-acid--CoA ligase [Sphingopyxis macrogoltabida]|uniref:3-methylmercaptopropionyl-CoA ligase n=1 Tax=Sphingopyxis macrogoltabida TaxID=33050 RepID=A0A2W5MRM6_SPHMC|nr:MAG: fatty-acid--CoA ligase [Sphingopyxis macrogoltabida]